MTAFHLNVQSLNNKTDVIPPFFDQYDFDVVCLTEHFLKEDCIKFINFSGYILQSYYCRKKHIHGGVCIYVKNTINCKSLDLSCYGEEFHSEFCGVEFDNIIIIGIYRSCVHGDFNIFLSNLEGLLNFIHMKFKKNIILMGDFNVNFNKPFLPNVVSLLELFGSFNLKQTIFQPTRIDLNSSSCIDGIFTDVEFFSADVINAGFSDHLGQRIIFESAIFKSTCNYISRNISHKGLGKLKGCIMEANWESFYSGDNTPNNMGKFLTNLYCSNIENIFPFKSKKQKTKNMNLNWFNNDLKKMRNRVATLKIISTAKHCPLYKNLYSSYYKYYRKSILAAKKQAYDNYISASTHKSKAAWKIINSEKNININSSKGTSLTPDEFNEFFAGIADDIISSLPHTSPGELDFSRIIPSTNKTFFLYPTTEIEVRESFLKINNSSSFDIYGINYRILKDSFENILKPFTVLINKCFHNGVFPESFKISKVIPLYKKGEKNSLDNYRPISIVPLFGKIIERIMKNRLVDFFEENNILCSSQYGFRKNRSTTKAVLRVLEGVVGSLERGEHAVLSLCDLSKAFDCVSHDILLQKLEHYGVRGIPLNLIKDYLEERTQCVEWDSKTSKLCNISSGVPQGSILGPLLFIIFINDLCFFMANVLTVKFADDTTFISSCKSVSLLDQNSGAVVDRAQLWFNFNKLKLNREKTQKLLIPTDNSLALNDSVKLLGITIDDNLSWSCHVDNLGGELSGLTFLIRRLKTFIGFDALRMCYFGIFHSKISYGVVLWGNTSAALRIFRLQKRVVRILSGAGYKEHCRPLFKKLKIMPLPCVFIYFSLIEIHESKNSISSSSKLHSYNMRKDILTIPKFRLTKSKNNSLHLNLYNVLASETQHFALSKFKYLIKMFLLKHCFYSVTEFLNCSNFNELL